MILEGLFMEQIGEKLYLCRDLVICHRRTAVSEVKQQLPVLCCSLHSNLGHDL